ncbi:MAG: reverse transcriptase domain-containing protein [Odoribacter sp.]
MKRIGNLYEKIISLENLRLADKKARRKKGNRYGIRLHDKNKEEDILQLHRQLVLKTFHTSSYDVFTIHDPKERDIYRLPYYPDRIVHHAIMNIMEPIWGSIFTMDTFSCIKKRGINGAMLHVKRSMEDTDGSRYCLKIDVRKFYPSIDHDILKTILRKKIKDSDLLWLLDEIIDSAVGVPIGNYLSQYFANLYLSYFDHWIKEVIGLRYYCRYADDMVFLHADKSFLHGLLVQINHYLMTELNLNLKDNYQIFPVDSRGIDFVGFVFYHTHTKIRKSIKKNFCRAAAKTNKREDMTAKEYKKNLCGWLGWAKHSNSKHLLKTILKPEYYEVR